MPQLLHTGRYGTIEVEKSWTDGPLHICKLTDGGYAYVSGLPVNSEADIRKAIPPGPDRDAALAWLNRVEEPEARPGKRIIINPDGSCAFEDGSPVENVSDILAHIPPGPFQDAAYKWLQEKLEKQKAVEAKAAKPAGMAAQKVAGKAKAAVKVQGKRPRSADGRFVPEANAETTAGEAVT
ncbi:MAG: hypothetical protein QME75_12440 [Deltaproteobacteria bacterium]|nr:hypothetical protein [Deltaproteobacteria bacterium]